MTYRQVARKLAALGCQELPRRGGGAHRQWFNPTTRRGTVLPDWRGRHLKVGTVRAAVRQLGVEWQDFQDAEQAGLGEEVELVVQDSQVLIRGMGKPRQGWEEAFRTMAQLEDDRLVDDDLTGLTRWDKEEWEW